jgi:hypothetical protein
MSFGGDLNQKISVEMQQIGGDVADDVVRKVEAMAQKVRELAEMFEMGVISGDKLVSMKAKLSRECATLIKQSKEFTQALDAEWKTAVDANEKMVNDRIAAANKKNQIDRMFREGEVRDEKSKFETVAAASSSHNDREIARIKALAETKRKAAEEAIRLAGMEASAQGLLAKATKEHSDWINFQGNQFNESSKKIAFGVKDITGSMNQGASGTRAFGGGMIQLAYTLDDVQYGFGAVQNNIVPVITAFGVGGPYASAIAIGTASTVLLFKAFKNMDGLLNTIHSTITAGIPVYDSNIGRMKALEEQTHKTANEQRELNERKKEEQEIDAIREGKSAKEEERIALIDKAFKESGGSGQIVGKVAEVMASTGMGQNEERTKEIQAKRDVIKEKQNGMLPYLQFARDYDKAELEKLISDDKDAASTFVNNAAGSLVNKARKDPQQLKALMGYIKSSPGSFDKNILANLSEATPEFQEELKNTADMVAKDQPDNERRLKKRKDEEKKKDDKQWEGMVDRWQEGNTKVAKFNKKAIADDDQDSNTKATAFLGGKGGIGDQMGGTITARTAAGENAEAIATAMRKQTVELLSKFPQFANADKDDAMATKVVNIAEKMVDRVILKQTGKIAASIDGEDETFVEGAGNIVEAGSAKAQVASDKASNKALSKTQRQVAGANRANRANAKSQEEFYENSQKEGIAQEFFSRGANPQQAYAMAQTAFNKMKQGVDLISAMNTTQMDFVNKLNEIDRKLNNGNRNQRFMRGSLRESRQNNINPGGW